MYEQRVKLQGQYDSELDRLVGRWNGLVYSRRAITRSLILIQPLPRPDADIDSPKLLSILTLVVLLTRRALLWHVDIMHAKCKLNFHDEPETDSRLHGLYDKSDQYQRS